MEGCKAPRRLLAEDLRDTIWRLRLLNSIYEQLVAASADQLPFALGVISGVKGSSPQKKGAKAIFFADGRILGTLGGGCLEAEVRERARLAIQKREPTQFDLVLDHDFGWDDGLICGGKVSGLILPQPTQAISLWKELAERGRVITWGVTDQFEIAQIQTRIGGAWIYSETVSPPIELWIAGSGHVAQALAALAQQLDFRVTVFDDRPELANHKQFPAPVQLRVNSWKVLLQEPVSTGPTFGVILTRGHQHDALVLRDWIQRSFQFLGMIGSRRKWRLIRTQFLEDNLASVEALDRVHCPVGVAIDAVSVPEIAVSILAQLIQERTKLLSPQCLRAALDTNPSESAP